MLGAKTQETPGAMEGPHRVVFDPARGQRVPVWIWGRDVDDETVRQLTRIASRPYVVERVAAMPDAHVSEKVSVGTVFATESTVVPGALGGDLGCGVSATRLGIDAAVLDRRVLARAIEAFTAAIPTGDAVHRRGLPLPDAIAAAPLSTRALSRTRDTLGGRHLGTLGGGNHFVEIDRDADGEAWLLVHSGSRGLGAAVCGHHARAASSADALAGLDTRTDAGAAYFSDHLVALDFARANRAALAARAAEVLRDVIGRDLPAPWTIDVHHNFVACEHWFGRDLLVHRKGAIHAARGAHAVIPGSMGTASYLVVGRGLEAAFGSSSHGAGRVMSRKEARARIDPRALTGAMRRVVFDSDLTADLVEEAPQAYRDIGRVLDDQRDLVERGIRLEPLAVLKGGRR